MRIIVTGAAGLIASHLCDLFIEYFSRFIGGISDGNPKAYYLFYSIAS